MNCIKFPTLTVLAIAATITIPLASATAQTTTTQTATTPAQVVDTLAENYKRAPEPPRFVPLAPGAVDPKGWLLDWAEAAANGITGDLENRHIVFEKSWTGKDFKSKGSAGRGLRWPLEQSAYWLDGSIRLGYILDDDELKQTAKDRLDKVVEGVNNGGETFIWWEPKEVLQADGQNLPFDRFTRIFNNWAHAHMGRALVAYYRATGDPEILKALTKVYSDFQMPPLGKDEFYPHGAATNLDPMLLTYALSGDKTVLENALEFIDTDHFQELISEWRTEKLPDGHTVLYYEHARVPAITSTWTGDREALEATERVLQAGLDQHGLPVGMASGQEHLMGKGAIRGLETCTAAVSGYTYSWMLQLTGNRKYADQLEHIFLNASPAAISRDYDLACYFQTMNRVDGVVPIHTIEGITGYDFSKTAGPTLCCVANTTRMIPDYVEAMWMASLDGGLAAVVYGPSSVTTSVGGKTVTIGAETNYPFRSSITLNIAPESAMKFPLYLRIPGWCKSPSIVLNGEDVNPAIDADGFVKLDRQWKKGDIVKLDFPMNISLEISETTPVPDTKYFERPTRAIPITKVKAEGKPYASVHYGPLLFALPLPDETPNKARGGAQWQYALNMTPGQAGDEAEVVNEQMPDPFAWQLDAPLKLKVPAIEFDWKPSNTEPLPDSPITQGKKTNITLVPYGTTKFRIAMFPLSEKMAAPAPASTEEHAAAKR